MSNKKQTEFSILVFTDIVKSLKTKKQTKQVIKLTKYYKNLIKEKKKELEQYDECEDCKHFDKHQFSFSNACKRSPKGCKFEK